MTHVEILDTARDRADGYKVDMSRGQRIGRVSSEWFSRPADERYLSLSDLYAAVRGRTERSRARSRAQRTGWRERAEVTPEQLSKRHAGALAFVLQMNFPGPRHPAGPYPVSAGPRRESHFPTPANRDRLRYNHARRVSVPKDRLSSGMKAAPESGARTFHSAEHATQMALV